MRKWNRTDFLLLFSTGNSGRASIVSLQERGVDRQLLESVSRVWGRFLRNRRRKLSWWVRIYCCVLYVCPLSVCVDVSVPVCMWYVHMSVRCVTMYILYIVCVHLWYTYVLPCVWYQNMLALKVVSTEDSIIVFGSDAPWNCLSDTPLFWTR